MPSLNATGRLLLSALSVLFAAPCFGQGLTAFAGRVTAVPEGDLITVSDAKNKEYRIRLSGIDAPEPAQDYGAAARNFLSGLVLDQQVTVIGRRYNTDGQLVAQVFLLGRDVSYSMLLAGLAWYDKNNDDDQTKDDRKRYVEGEKFARGKKDNIWSQARAVAPWDFRKDNPAPREPERTLALTQLSQPVEQPPAQAEPRAPARGDTQAVTSAMNLAILSTESTASGNAG